MVSDFIFCDSLLVFIGVVGSTVEGTLNFA
jgi:hypothetical protein